VTFGIGGAIGPTFFENGHGNVGKMNGDRYCVSHLNLKSFRSETICIIYNVFLIKFKTAFLIKQPLYTNNSDQGSPPGSR
jgi:hypothetical protein